MRITKRVEEYIRSNLRKQYRETGAGLAEAREAAEKERVEYATALLTAMQAQLIVRFPYLDGKMKSVESMARSLTEWRYDHSDLSDAERAYWDFVDSENKAVGDKLNEIIITMELGGTKEDLDRMMSDAFKKNPDE